MLQVDESSDGKKVSFQVGQTIEISLQENPSMGFRWHMVPDSQAAPLVTVDDAFVLPPGPTGRGGIHRWLFRAERSGEQSIELVYQRPWEQRPSRRFTIDMSVGP
jgi:inhibitor of cysteine peptidase